MTILRALKLRGAQVEYVMCDGLYTDCDLYWEAVLPRPADVCGHCQADVARLAASMGMDYRWLGRYLNTDEAREAKRWASSLQPEELLTATYGEWRVGQWVLSSVQSHFRRNDIDVSDPAIERGMRSYVYSGLIACFALDRLLEESAPDIFVVFNGRQSSPRVALELARARGIRVVLHERGLRPETLTLVENVSCNSLRPIRQCWSEWGDVPLTSDELQDAAGLMAAREHGRDLGWRALSAPLQPLDDVRERLGLRVERPAWVLFTSSDDEVAGDDEYGSRFASQREWIERTIEHVRRHEEIDLVIRVHPNTGSRRSTGANRVQLEEMRRLAENLPPNVRMIDADEEISSYSLMDLCSVGLVWVSTAGLELACKGKNVVVAAGNRVAGTSFVHTVAERETYEDLLDSLIGLPVAAVSPEITRLALRFAYCLFFRLCIPFPLIRMPDAHTGELTYDSLDALLPGREPGLDRCCRIVLEGEAVCPPPGEAERARDAAAEDAYLDGGVGDPAVTVIVTCFNYGRWLPESVGSVLAQTFTDFELIIVDDGSTDDSLEVARRLAAGDQRITAITQPNSGQPAIPRNLGIGRARGRYIVCLDADDRLGPTVLEACVAALDADPSAGMAWVQMQEFGASDRYFPYAEWSLEALKRRNIVPCAAMFRRAASDAAGGYNLNVRGYEDWDHWLGIAAAGFTGRPAPDAVFYYRVHEGGVFDQSLGRDQRLKAQIVVNRPGVFGDGVLAWAEGVLADDPAALAVGHEVGLIPDAGIPPRLPAAARSVAILAFSDELVADPALLGAYGAAISGADDVTLVIVTPDPEPLVRAVESAGLNGDGTPDMIAVSEPPAGVAAVFSRREHDGLPRYDETTMGALRGLLAA